jgi:hypothetical protein
MFSSCAVPQKGGATQQTSGSEEKQSKGKLIPLSTALIKSMQLSNAELQQLQFVLHGGITVEGVSSANQKSVENGTVILKEKGVHLTHAVVDGTLGIWGGNDKSTIFVRFDQDGSNRVYPFSPGAAGIYYFKPSADLRISFDGQIYNVSPESREAYLQVYVSNEKEVSSVNTQAPGIPIQEGSGDGGGISGGQDSYFLPPVDTVRNNQNQPAKPAKKSTMPDVPRR